MHETVKADRRIRKTQALFRDTLTQLLLEKELKNISVSELTEMADVNRSTFYLHYKDIYDLFEQIENDVLAEFTRIISHYKRQDHLAWTAVMQDLFQYISANGDLFRVILKTKESNFLVKVLEMNRPQNPAEWRKLFASDREEYYEYYFAFCTSGCIEMLRTWFNKGMPESAEQMAGLTDKLMTNCTRDLP